MMRQSFVILTTVAIICGCSTSPIPNEKTSNQKAIAIEALNKQIEAFNAFRCYTPTMGIFPIDKRVTRIKHDSKSDQITTFDEDGLPFIILKRESDGRFKGVLEQRYHELVGSGPGQSHSWGHVEAEFYLDKGMF